MAISMAPACTHPRQILADGRLMPCATCWDAPTLEMPELRPFSFEPGAAAPTLEFWRSEATSHGTCWWNPCEGTVVELLSVSAEMVGAARRRAEQKGITPAEWWRRTAFAGR